MNAAGFIIGGLIAIIAIGIIFYNNITSYRAKHDANISAAEYIKKFFKK